ncbi:uncharacterized protein LOC110858947 [Folsomia candida]|uniref:DUF4789 domain-containing protein n=1 Tax=Folsomia candida TaxID=158441 RepID=A0A226F2C9_FOLCA|nr:uncharacterized protein LOC110858947 [Folsomia candida]OXA63351.1 hypothetical protein Fcan01_02391 [Folsomia candida]
MSLSKWFPICLVLLAFTLGAAQAAGMLSASSRAAAKTKTELCPEMAAKSTYEMWSTRYDNKTKVCYKTGTKGPCGNNMIFYAVSDDPVYGECDCNYEICRSMIYSREYDECFEAFQQGHCPASEWLVADKNGQPVCERNLCLPPPKYSSKYQWALYKGRCERLYKPIHDCKPDEYLWVPKGHRYPVCGKAECTNPHTFVPELQCELGSRLYDQGRCIRRKGI